MKRLLLASLVLLGGTLMALTDKEQTLCAVVNATARGDMVKLEDAYARA